MEIPELHLEKIKGNPMCFGCGKSNPHSLKMSFFKMAKPVKPNFFLTKYHQSWPGYVHGGALMAALDEGIGWSLFSQGIYAVTANIEIRPEEHGPPGEPLIVSSEIIRKTSRTVEVEARLNRQDDSVVAEAKALLIS